MSDKTLAYAQPHPADPDSYRMSIGDHLEELRKRLILGIIGFALALGVCLFFGKQAMTIFCRPLIDTLRKYEINPQIYSTSVSDPFMVYLKISMIGAIVIASPWILWQIWMFVAAGLYPHERKMVTRFIPMSIGLLITGVAFVYLLVLPWTLQFFVAFSISIPMPDDFNPTPTTMPAVVQSGAARFVEAIDGDPAQPLPFQIWFDTSQQRMKFSYDGKVRVIQFGPANLMSPMITLPDYIDMVFGMLVVFGLSFQLPLVILALAFIGIVDVVALRGMRKIVYFVMAIAAAVITPGDVITTTVLLMVPLCLLFELGIFLAARAPKREVLL
jgi:sec-independent protein translocase protein TatC